MANSEKVTKSPMTLSNWEVISGFDQEYLWPWFINVFSGIKSSEIMANRTIATTKNGISDRNRELITEFAEWLGFRLTYIEISLPENLPTSNHFTPIVYSRLVVAEEMQENFIWMDVDTILLRGWDELLTLPRIPAGFVSRAIPEPLSSLHEDLNNQAILKANKKYFNAGIMQIDPVAFRERGFNHYWKVLAKEYNERNFRYADQCILNYMFAGLNISLPKELNFIPAYWKDRYLDSAPARIIHFAGERKPWLVPKLERNRLFDRFRVKQTDSEFFRLYWKTEQELISLAREHSIEFSSNLGLVRNSKIRPMEISSKRLINRIR